jgi:protein-S-isoprenylcysteine O-methyltransferase Ste14
MKDWQTWLWVLGVAVVLGWAFVNYRSHLAWSPHRIAGGAIAVPGFCLWALARLQLGKSFAISAQAKELVTHGLYSKTQNPVYVFGTIFIAGIIVYSGRPVFFLMFLTLIPVQWPRVREERRVLEQKFGDAYREYRKHTWF